MITTAKAVPAPTPFPPRVASVDAALMGDQLGLLTAKDVCQHTGLTYRQLDMWTRRGLVVPAVQAHGSGSARLYHPGVVDVINELVARIEACPFHPHNG